jgi:hypothetical protein
MTESSPISGQTEPVVLPQSELAPRSLTAPAARATDSSASEPAASRLGTGPLVGAAAGAVAAWTTLRVALGYPPGAWPDSGDYLIGPGTPKELVVHHGLGYDGRFLYRLAIEPFTTRVTGHGITLDNPGYRQQRILTALLAHLVSGVPGVSTALAIILVNAAAVVLALVVGVRLAEALRLDWRWGLLFGLPACLPRSFALDLTEPVEWAALLCALLAVRRGRWHWAAVALTAAVLARETAGIVIAGLLTESALLLLRRRMPAARLWLLLPVVVEGAWQLRLWFVWGSVPAFTGLGNTVVANSSLAQIHTLRNAGTSHSIPLLGIVRTFFNGLFTGDTTHPASGVVFLVERVVLVLLIATAAWLLAARQVRVGVGLATAWLLAALVALTMAGWVEDVQFLRPTMEVWGLSTLVLSQSRGRWSRILLRLAIAVVCWQVIFSLAAD